MSRRPTAQQIQVQIGLMVSSISEGIIAGHMAGVIAAMQNDENYEDYEDASFSYEDDVDDIASLITSRVIATSTCGLGVGAIMIEVFGRGRTVTILSIGVIISWIMLYFATTSSELVYSRVLAGLFSGGVTLAKLVTSAEYASPDIRSFYIYLVNSVAVMIGTILGFTLCVPFLWKSVAWLGIIASILSALLPCFWIESPFWLAAKGRLRECEANFRTLRGYSKSANEELNLLIKFVKSKNNHFIRTNKACFCLRFFTIFQQECFWNLLPLSVASIVYRVLAGKYFNISMFHELSGNEEMVSFSLLVNGLYLLGSCASCVFISSLKVRTLLFTTGTVACSLMMLLGILVYFNRYDFVYFASINTRILYTYLTILCAGPYPILEGLNSEIYPLESKGCYIFWYSLLGILIMFLNMEFGATMFNLLGYHGVFIMNSVLMFLSLGYLWYYLPETKGRSLLEIELYFKSLEKKEEDRLNNQII